SQAKARADRDRIAARVEAAWSFLRKDCQKNPSQTCKDMFQPFSSYIVGDMISPTTFKVTNGQLTFEGRGVCWDFSRDTVRGESSSPGLKGIRLLRPLSEAFCKKVRDELSGIHPLVYRAGTRALQYAALMRHYKERDSSGFDAFVKSVEPVT